MLLVKLRNKSLILSNLIDLHVKIYSHTWLVTAKSVPCYRDEVLGQEPQVSPGNLLKS